MVNPNLLAALKDEGISIPSSLLLGEWEKEWDRPRRGEALGGIEEWRGEGWRNEGLSGATTFMWGELIERTPFAFSPISLLPPISRIALVPTS